MENLIKSEAFKFFSKVTKDYSELLMCDFLYYCIKSSKYIDKKTGKRFFLLPNIQYIEKEFTKLSKSTCVRILQNLAKNEVIKKVKTKCADGAVRLKIFLGRKLTNTAELNNDSKNSSKSVKETKKVNSFKLNESFFNNTKVTKKKEKITKKEKRKNAGPQNFGFDFDLDLNNHTDEMEFFVGKIARKREVRPQDLFHKLCELQSKGCCTSLEEIVEKALVMIKVYGENVTPIPKKRFNLDKKKQPSVENRRYSRLTIKQSIEIKQLLEKISCKSSNRFCSKEVFSWAEFQITNFEYHFKGKTFKECLKIITSLLFKKDKTQYSKPYGYVCSRYSSCLFQNERSKV